MNWLQRNSKTIIKTAYILPILIAAGVSISHVIAWYGLTNPVTWAVYLSIGIEIAALSALAGITTNIGRGAYIPFLIVTFIQFIGNIFFAYQFIDITGPMFKDWVDLVGDIFGKGDMQLHRRILALIGGGFIPMISLSFLHLLVSFTNKEEVKSKTDIDEKGSDNASLDSSKQEIEKKGEDAGIFENLHTNPATPNAVIFSEPIIVEKEVEESEPIIVEKEVEESEPIIVEDPKLNESSKVQIDDIKEIKEMKDSSRNFSVQIPKRGNNSVTHL